MKVQKYMKTAGLLSMMLWSVQTAKATSFILGDYVYTAKGNDNVVLTGITQLQFGFFTGGFTPTVANANQWMSNFTGVSGYFDGSSPEWSASIDLSGNAVYPVGTQLSVILFNFGVGANAASLLNSGLTSQYQAAIVTNPLWTIVASSGPDVTQYYYSLDGRIVDTGSTQTPTLGSSSALVGSLGAGSVTLVPEPSTGALLMIGSVGLVALRRLRKV